MQQFEQIHEIRCVWMQVPVSCSVVNGHPCIMSDLENSNRVRDEAVVCVVPLRNLRWMALQVAAILQGLSLDKSFFSQKPQPQVNTGTVDRSRGKQIAPVFNEFICWFVHDCSADLSIKNLPVKNPKRSKHNALWTMWTSMMICSQCNFQQINDTSVQMHTLSLNEPNFGGK